MKRLNPDKLRENVLKSMNSDLAASNIAGAAVMVAQNGELLLDERVGYKDIRTREPLGKNTIFRLASMTKPVTGFAFLLGIERGYFGYDDLLTDHFPEFKKMPIGKIADGKVIPDRMPKNPIRLYQLLSNSSGFMCAGPIESVLKPQIPAHCYESARKKVEYCLGGALCFEPGEGYGYSQSAAYDVISLLIEKYSGVGYADFLNENVFKPLGIKDITYKPTSLQWSRFITMHEKLVNVGMATVDMGERIFEGNPTSYASAGAGLAGTIEDYFIFAEMLRGKGEYKGVRLVSEDTFKLYAKPAVDMKYMGEGAMNSWGLGVRVTSGHNVLPDGTFGWSGAYGTHFFIEPENEICAIYMKNNRWHDSRGAGNTGKQFEIDVMSALE